MGQLASANSRPRVSIVVPNFNGKNLLRECLDSIKNLHYDDYEVIVVDNSSSDGSAEMVRQRYPWVTLLVTERIKMSQACNRGMRFAKGDIIVTMLNNDMTVDRYWLDHLIVPLMKRENGIVGGKIYNHGARARDLIGSTRLDWNRFSISPSFVSSMIRSRNRPTEREKIRYDASHYDSPEPLHEVDYVEVPTLRRDVMNVIGGIDEEYEHYYLDPDYCVRAKKAGYRVVYVPNAVSWHRVAATVGALGTRAYYIERKDGLRFLIKNSDPCLILYSFYSWILYCLTASLWNLFRRRRVDKVRLDIRAVVWNLANLRQTLYSRRKLWL